MVVYYSASGTTEKIAKYIANAANADIFEIQPVEPYTADDLDWTDESSRVVKEHDDEKPLPDAKGMLAALLDDNAEVIRQIRTDLETMEKEESKDFGTSNFLEDMIEKKEKVTWMIRAHLE